MQTATQAVPSSARLVYRPVTEGDAPLLHTHWNRAQVRKYLWDDLPVDEATVRAAIGASQADLARAGYGLWAISLAVNGEFVGVCGLRRVAAERDDVEVIYSLEPSMWGRGFATEAARAAITFAFETLHLPRVLGGFDAENIASSQVLERLGLRPMADATQGASAPGGVVYWELTARLS